MLYAFNDAADGYYQTEVADGEPMPEWTQGLTPCAVIPVVATTLFAPLTPRQIRMALSRAGLRETVEGAVSAGDQDLKDWWEWSQTYERLHPAVVAMGAALGQTDEAMDALWALGATL